MSELTDGGTYGIKLLIADETPEGYKKFEYQQAHTQFAEGLLHAIEECRYPPVVEFSRTERRADFNHVEIELKARLTPIRYHNVEIAVKSYSYRRIEHGPLTLKERIKILFIGHL